MTIERNNVTSALVITDIINGQLVHEQYYGYTKREAIALFKQQHNAKK